MKNTLCLLALALAPAAHAIDWMPEAELGIVNTTGNSETTSARGRFALVGEDARGAQDETDRRQRPEEHTDQNRNDDANNSDSAILAGQIGASAFLDSGCNFLHPRCAGRCSKHRAACYNSIKHGNKPAQYGQN